MLVLRLSFLNLPGRVGISDPSTTLVDELYGRVGQVTTAAAAAATGPVATDAAP